MEPAAEDRKRFAIPAAEGSGLAEPFDLKEVHLDGSGREK